MVVSVALEIATYGVVAATAQLAATPSGAVVVLDRLAAALNTLVVPTLGTAVLTAALAMWHSAHFNRLMCGVGLLGGSLMTVAGAAAVGWPSGAIASTAQGGVLPFWIWMLWTGVVVWRRRPQAAEVVGAQQPAPRSHARA